MPRGKVIKRSLEEQISMLEEDIRIAQNKLNKLQNKWKELQKQKREEDMAGIYTLIQESGMSLEQVRQILAEGTLQPNSTDSAETANLPQDAAVDIIDIA